MKRRMVARRPPPRHRKAKTSRRRAPTRRPAVTPPVPTQHVELSSPIYEAILRSLRSDVGKVEAAKTRLGPLIRQMKVDRKPTRFLEAYQEPVECLALEMPRAIQSLTYIHDHIVRLETIRASVTREKDRRIGKPSKASGRVRH